MKSLHFGSGSQQLYGVYHHPLSMNYNPKSILICSSINPEHIHPYRLLRVLAESLAKKGHHVFRFDWYGCGDSGGNSSDGNTRQWVSDARFAAEKLLDLTGNQTFSIIGLRFGATIAWNSFSDSDILSSFVLWEPVISGADWIKEMQSVHSMYLIKSPETGRSFSKDEILGFPFSESLITDISSLNISNSIVPKCQKVHLLYSGNPKRYFSFCKSLKYPVSVETLNSPDFWTSSPFNKVLMSHPAITSIITYFDQVRT